MSATLNLPANGIATGGSSTASGSGIQGIRHVSTDGAKLDGVTDDSAAIQASLNSGASTVYATGGTGLIGTSLIVPKGVTFVFDKLIPASATNTVVTIYGGTSCKGLIDTSAFTYTGNAFVVEGDAENHAGQQFRIDTKTDFDIRVNMAVGVNGTACYFKATTTISRIMGVKGRVYVNGGSVGVQMTQTSTDLSQFINSNDIEIWASQTYQPLVMSSSYSTGYGLDGNKIMIQSQPPATGITQAAAVLCGQGNDFWLDISDWVSGPTIPAASIRASSRQTRFFWLGATTDLQNNSTDWTNVIHYMIDGWIAAMGMKPTRSDVSVHMAAWLKPDADNTYDLGDVSLRWKTVYAVTGAINTSDERQKQQVREIGESEARVARRIKGLLRCFKFNDAVEKKADGARIHVGVMAQEVGNAFAAEGLNPHNYAMFCYDEWEGGNNRYGIRYEELLAFVIAAM